MATRRAALQRAAYGGVEDYASIGLYGRALRDPFGYRGRQDPLKHRAHFIDMVRRDRHDPNHPSAAIAKDRPRSIIRL